MAKSVFTATDPNGKVHRRTSENRTYTHTVVFQHSKEIAIANAHHAVKGWTRDAEYYAQGAAMTGEEYFEARSTNYTARLGREYFDKEHAKAKEIAAANGPVAEYVAKRLAERLAEIEARDFTEWHNAGWCGRLDLAQKLASQNGGTILEASRVTK